MQFTITIEDQTGCVGHGFPSLGTEQQVKPENNTSKYIQSKNIRCLTLSIISIMLFVFIHKLPSRYYLLLFT